MADYLFPRPTASFGYYRGNPIYRGDTGTEGPQVSGTSVFSQGQGSATGTGGWTPTILYLFVLILIEMFIFAYISRKV
jgi:hypothetical protein